jgi:phage terminase small subunit
MAQIGRPPVPVEQKRLLGNPGKRPLPDKKSLQQLEPITKIPNPPRQLFEAGQELWDRVWENGLTWISPHSDIELLIMTCEQIDERIKLRTSVWNNNRSDERKALRALDKEIVSNLSLLGFTPTDRTRLGVAEVKKMSRLEEIITKRANRE